VVDLPSTHRALEALGGPGRGRWKAAREKLGAALATSQGEPRRALELLASARTPCGLLLQQGGEQADHHYRLLHILAGRAYEALTEPDSAIAEYEAYFTERYTGYPIPLDAAFVFDTLERLGRLHEARGDSAEAAGYYTRAADLWKDADAELQPRAQALRARAAALGGVGQGGA
jgi:tetratricopeptide (TPR) repeat protein